MDGYLSFVSFGLKMTDGSFYKRMILTLIVVWLTFGSSQQK